MRPGNREIDQGAAEPIRDRIAVLYDDHCAFCRDAARHLAELDWLNRLERIGLRRWDRVRQRLGPWADRIGERRAREELHVVLPDGRIRSGFAAFRAIAWHLPLFWPIAPLLHLPGVEWVGQKLYLAIARNRNLFTSS